MLKNPEKYQRNNGKEWLDVIDRYIEPLGKRELIDIRTSNGLGHIVTYRMVDPSILDDWEKVEKPVETSAKPRTDVDLFTCYRNAIKDYKKGEFKHIGINILKRDGIKLEDVDAVFKSKDKAFANQIAMRWAAKHNISTMYWFDESAKKIYEDREKYINQRLQENTFRDGYDGYWDNVDYCPYSSEDNPTEYADWMAGWHAAEEDERLETYYWAERDEEHESY